MIVSDALILWILEVVTEFAPLLTDAGLIIRALHTRDFSRELNAYTI